MDNHYTERIGELYSTLNASASQPRPMVLYRQSAPFHERPESGGAKRSQMNSHIGMPQRPCRREATAWVDSPFLAQTERIMPSLGVPMLHVRDPLRARYDAHVENGDCAHWSAQPW